MHLLETRLIMINSDETRIMLKTLHAQIEESQDTIREQREELAMLRARVELLSSRQTELQTMLFQARDQLVQSQSEATSLRGQVDFMVSTRAWRFGERYVRARNRVRGLPGLLRGRGLRGKLWELREGTIDLGIVSALVMSLLFLPIGIFRLLRGLARLRR
jgi:hypothetical protein